MAEVRSSTSEEHRRQQIRATAIETLLKLRKEQRPASDEEIRRARQEGRP